jgi:hypothetical protein
MGRMLPHCMPDAELQQQLFLTPPIRVTCKQSLCALPCIQVGPYATMMFSVLQRAGMLAYLCAMAASARVADVFLWQVFKTRLAGAWMLWAVHVFFYCSSVCTQTH